VVQSSHDSEKLTTLKEYVARMKEDQTEIFLSDGRIAQGNREFAAPGGRPEKGYEVLFLTDPVDEL